MGNIFANIKLPEYPDFTGDRARYEAMKHAEQQRKIQAQQALMQQAQFGRQLKDWERQDAWQAALGNNPLVDPETGRIHATTLPKLMAIDAPKTLTLNKTIEDAREAKLKTDAAEQARREHHQKLGFYDFTSAMGIEDPQKRFEHTMSRFDRYEKLGVLQQDELEDLATNGMTPNLIDRVGTRLLGPEEYGKIQAQALTRQEAQKKAKSEDITRPAEETTKLLTADKARSQAAAVHLAAAAQAKNQTAWEIARNEVPEQDRMRVPEKLDPNYDPLELGMSPAEIASNRRQNEPNQATQIVRALNSPKTPIEDLPRLHSQLEDLKKYQQSIQPPRDAPIDYPGIIAAAQKDPAYLAGLPGDVVARVTPELSRLGIARPTKNPITPAIKGKVEGVKTLESALQAYENELKKVGPTFQAGKGAGLNTAYVNLMSLMKGEQMYQLGVLQPADMALVEKALADPSGFKGNLWLGTSGMLEQLQAVKNMLATRKSILNETYDIPNEVWTGTKKSSAGAQPPPASAPGTIPSPLLSGGKPSPALPQGSGSEKPAIRWGRDANGRPVRLP